MKIVVIVLSVIFLLSAIAPISKRENWWIRWFDFPYLQFTLLGLVCILGWLVCFPQTWPEWSIFGTTVVFVGYRMAIIYPYTRFKKPTLPWSDSDSTTLRILSANVLMTNDDYKGFLQLVEQENPDILLLVEVDQKWEMAINEKLKAKYAFQVLHPLNNTYGIMLFSKNEIEDPKIQFLVEKDVPSIHAQIKLNSGENIQFYGLHPKPPAPSENSESTPRDAELVMVGRMARKCEIPVIVAGDMNDVAWSHTTRLFMRISGLLDPRMGRGFYNTFHAEKPLLRWPLDHVFLSHHFRIAKLKRLDNFHSDHFPILIDVTLNPSVRAIVSKEHANGDDREEAHDKIKLVK